MMLSSIAVEQKVRIVHYVVVYIKQRSVETDCVLSNLAAHQTVSGFLQKHGPQQPGISASTEPSDEWPQPFEGTKHSHSRL